MNDSDRNSLEVKLSDLKDERNSLLFKKKMERRRMIRENDEESMTLDRLKKQEFRLNQEMNQIQDELDEE